MGNIDIIVRNPALVMEQHINFGSRQVDLGQVDLAVLLEAFTPSHALGSQTRSSTDPCLAQN